MNDQPSIISPPTEPSNTVVFFHFPCADGFTAAWAAWRAHPNWDFNGIAHSDFATMFPDSMLTAQLDWDGEDIYFLDICPPAHILLHLANLVGAKGYKVYVLDHHKSAQAALDGLEHDALVKVFDMEKSGARLAWEHFHSLSDGAVPSSWLIDYVEDRDLWRFRYGDDTRDFSAYLFSLEYSFEGWDAVHEELRLDCQACCLEGAAIRRKHAKDTNEIVSGPMVVYQDVAGFRVPAVNVPYFYASEVGHALLERDKQAPFAVTYFIDNAGIKVSLRSDDNRQDVSEIARKFGGGGHRNAAGFTITSFDQLKGGTA